MNKYSKNFAFIFVWLYKLCRQDPLIFCSLIIVAGCWYGYEITLARPAMSFKGVPQIQNWQQPMHWFRTLRNQGFMVGYSDLRGNPLWAVYKLKPINQAADYFKRPQSFTTDWRTLNPAKHMDYKNSGFDRGHLAPNYAISRLYGREAQLDTFLMSNVSPQKPKLNQKLWQRLEQVEIDHFTRLNKEIWVITGPVFKGRTERLKFGWNIEIPDAFYKIFAYETESGAIKILAFLMPQTVKGDEALTRFLTTVDKIEQLTGLNFFSDLNDKLENKLEATVRTSGWKLNSVAHLSARY